MNNRRRSIRLKNYDYAQAGAYFVTICTHNRACVLGEMNDDTVRLSALGGIAANGLQWLETQYSHLQLDDWVIMPNHLHVILVLNHDHTTVRKPLGRLVGAFKTVTTKQINQLYQPPIALFWQRNYYEHVIRNEADLMRLREYIANNPLKWALDSLHP